MKKIIVITEPQFIENEVTVVESLFEAGLEILHIRKPSASLAELESFLRAIAPQYLKRVVLHSHYQLMAKYNIRGIHLTSHVWEELQEQGTLKEYIRPLQKRGLSISASTHSFAEIQRLPSTLDYVFLSPFFDSISKPSYFGSINVSEVEDFIFHQAKIPPIVALGGIQINTIAALKNIGLHGVALLGTIWQADNPTAAFQAFCRAF